MQELQAIYHTRIRYYGDKVSKLDHMEQANIEAKKEVLPRRQKTIHGALNKEAPKRVKNENILS